MLVTMTRGSGRAASWPQGLSRGTRLDALILRKRDEGAPSLVVTPKVVFIRDTPPLRFLPFFYLSTYRCDGRAARLAQRCLALTWRYECARPISWHRDRDAPRSSIFILPKAPDRRPRRAEHINRDRRAARGLRSDLTAEPFIGTVVAKSRRGGNTCDLVNVYL